MDINKIISDVTKYAEANPIAAGAAAVVLLYMLIKKPRILIALIVLALIWGAVMEVIARLFEKGMF